MDPNNSSSNSLLLFDVVLQAVYKKLDAMSSRVDELDKEVAALKAELAAVKAEQAEQADRKIGVVDVGPILAPV